MAKIITFSKIDMAKDLQDLDYLLQLVDTVDDAILPDTWQDAYEKWVNLRGLCSVMRAEMCQIVLRCIFSDTRVLEGLEFAQIFSVIEVTTRMETTGIPGSSYHPSGRFPLQNGIPKKLPHPHLSLPTGSAAICRETPLFHKTITGDGRMTHLPFPLQMSQGAPPPGLLIKLKRTLGEFTTACCTVCAHRAEGA